ncbi:MAG: undecaprenyl-diphosphate phosphatase [Phycisphaerae bacterium]|jgi:undecaprenyl-diphosphatase|nr:undecaprenyl-diphosphate phosphatase [Phycisphaerae bacterium]HOO18500.1 undecaprenyl-diphosphate phosphatase [Phycisphaerae bacterium]
MDALNTVVLGIIEGLTEFLPVSSTGHMVIAMPLLGVQADRPPWNTLLWVSQFAAILAVILYFWRDLWTRTFNPRSWSWRQHILVKLFFAMVPTVVLALLFKKRLDPLEQMPLAVAAALIVGAGLIELIDRRYRREGSQNLEDVTLSQAFFIGLIQCVSMVPGVSRAAATIMGGMALGLTPRVATEFSFYLAIPTMLGAALKTLHDHRDELTGNNAGLIVLGSAVSFVVALLVVAAFLEYVKRYRFTPFAVYRVVLGIVVIGLYMNGGFRVRLPQERPQVLPEQAARYAPLAANGAIFVQNSHMTGAASSGESSTSSTPPNPGMLLPESLSAASRFSSDSHKSPSTDRPAISRPKTSSVKSAAIPPGKRSVPEPYRP